MADLDARGVPTAMLEALVEFEQNGLVEFCDGQVWRLTEAGRRSPPVAETFGRIEATRRDPYGPDSLRAWGVTPGKGLRAAIANVRARR